MSEDLIGKVFSHLLVNQVSDIRKYNTLNYECLCSCGKVTLATKAQLINGKKKSCGCRSNIKPLHGSKYKTSIDDVFTHLTVVSEDRPTKSGHYVVDCKCACGNKKEIKVRDLILGRVVSCGCKQKDANKKHGMWDSRPYSIHGHMKRRCNSPDEAGYSHYGARGITYDQKWETFEGFWEDMQYGYSENLELDRIDPDKNYCKSNCRWVNSNIQSFNTGKRKDNSSGTTGVSWNKKDELWEVYIDKDGKRVRLGKYEDLELASFVRKEAELKYYGFYKHKEENKE